jgi:predicted RNA binding protein YcfA (HicA-like mRNA interferase family)
MGWTVVRTRGSHIRMQKHVGAQVLKITLSAHRPVKLSTLRQILIQARLDLDKFVDLI